MRARYYNPAMRRFVNADILAGSLDKFVTLNRYAYADCNPVMCVDPRGLSADERGEPQHLSYSFSIANIGVEGLDFARNSVYKYRTNKIKTAAKPQQKSVGGWILEKKRALNALDNSIGSSSKFAKALNIADDVLSIGGYIVDAILVLHDVGVGISENLDKGTPTYEVVTDAAVDFVYGMSFACVATLAGAAIGSLIPIPVLGTAVGGAVGYLVGEGLTLVSEYNFFGQQSPIERIKENVASFVNSTLEIGEQLSDATSETWGEILDISENISSWALDTVSDIWDVITA